MWMIHRPWVMNQINSNPIINDYKEINSQNFYSIITSIKVQRNIQSKSLISIQTNLNQDLEIKKKKSMNKKNDMIVFSLIWILKKKNA